MDEFGKRTPGLEWFKLYSGVVVDDDTNHEDGRHLCRIRVRIPTIFDGIEDDQLPWCIPFTDYSRGEHKNWGYGSVPPKDSKVLVAFQDGSVYHPVYMSHPIDDKVVLEELEENYPARQVLLLQNKFLCVIDTKSNEVFIRNPGRMSMYVVGDLDLTVKGDVSEKIMGNRNVSVAGDSIEHVKGDRTVFVEGDSVVITKGDRKVHDEGDYLAITRGDTKIHREGDVQDVTKGDTLIYNEGNTESVTKGDRRVHIKGDSQDVVKGDRKTFTKGAYGNVSYGTRLVMAGGRNVEIYESSSGRWVMGHDGLYAYGNQVFTGHVITNIDNMPDAPEKALGDSIIPTSPPAPPKAPDAPKPLVMKDWAGVRWEQPKDNNEGTGGP